MKKNRHLIFLVGLIGLIGCETQSQVAPKEVKPKKLVVLVYDISKSGDDFAILEDRHLDNLYDVIAANGGGRFYALHIKTNSMKQDPVTGNIARLDTLALQGNPYQMANRKKHNKKQIKVFKEQKSLLLNNITSEVVKPKSHNFSDVENALVLAANIMDMNEYKNWDRYLLIISDMLNDQPPYDGVDKMEAIDILTGSSIKVVRPSRSVQLNKAFPSATCEKYVSINDAIVSIGNQ